MTVMDIRVGSKVSQISCILVMDMQQEF